MIDVQYITIILSSLITIILIFEVTNCIKQNKNNTIYNKRFESLNKEVKEIINIQTTFENYFKSKIKSSFNDTDLFKIQINELNTKNKILEGNLKNQININMDIEQKINDIEKQSKELNKYIEKEISALEEKNNGILEIIEELDLDVSALYKVASKEINKEKYTTESSKTYEKESKDMALQYFCK